MAKTYELKWDEHQVWTNTAFITAEDEDDLYERLAKGEYDYPVDSEYSHTIEIMDPTVLEVEEEDVSSN